MIRAIPAFPMSSGCVPEMACIILGIRLVYRCAVDVRPTAVVYRYCCKKRLRRSAHLLGFASLPRPPRQRTQSAPCGAPPQEF